MAPQDGDQMEDHMSRWARENPEQMEAISRLPASEQNAAERAAVDVDVAAVFARLELVRDGRGDPYTVITDDHLEADYEDRQNGGEE